MGGRITRVLYKNERQNSMRGSERHSPQLRQLSVIFTLVMSSIASFLIGYLYRPYSYHSIDKLQHHMSKTQQTTDWLTFLFSFLCLIAMMFGYILRNHQSKESSSSKDSPSSKESSKESPLTMVQRINKLLLVISGLIFLIDIVSWVLSQEIAWIFRTAYGVMWIGFGNICVLLFNNVKLVQHRKECKVSLKQCQNHQTKEVDECNTKRTLFLILMLLIFETGIKSSQYMKQLRVDKMVKDVIEGRSSINHLSSSQHLKLESSSQHLNLQSTLLSLPFNYQTYIIESQFYQKLILRIIFLFLIFMITVTVIAFQKKSLFPFFLFHLKTNQYRQWFQNQIQQKQPNKPKYNKLSNNLLPRSIIMSTIVFSLGTIFIEYQTQNIRYQKANQSRSFENQVSFTSGSLFFLVTLGISQLIFKVSGYIKQRVIQKLVRQKYLEKKNEQRKIKGIEMGVLTGVFILLMIIYGTISYVLSPKGPQQQNQFVISYLLPLSTLLIIQSILTFNFISFTKEQLWGFPQTSSQPYISLTIMIIFVVKYVFPYQMILFLSKNIINYSILPFIRLLKEIFYLFVEKRADRSLDSEELVCTLVFVFVMVFILIAVNHQQSLKSVVDQFQLKQKKSKDNQDIKFRNPLYSDEDSIDNLTTNIIIEENLEEKDQTSKLLK